MRAAQIVEHEVFDGDMRDERGNTVELWRDPVEIAVYGWWTQDGEEPAVGGHERVKVDAKVLARSSWRPEPRDRVILPGFGKFEVVGAVADYDHGPFGYRPGVVVNLVRVTG